MQGSIRLQMVGPLNPTCSMSSLYTASSMTQRSSTLEPSPHFTVLVPIFLDLHVWVWKEEVTIMSLARKLAGLLRSPAGAYLHVPADMNGMRTPPRWTTAAEPTGSGVTAHCWGTRPRVCHEATAQQAVCSWQSIADGARRHRHTLGERPSCLHSQLPTCAFIAPSIAHLTPPTHCESGSSHAL